LGNSDVYSFNNSNSFGSHQKKGYSQFFIKPRIKISYQLKPHEVEILENGRTSERPLNPEVFNRIVWTMEVANRYLAISKFVEASSCLSRI
jgi:hypothetical protein